MLIFEFYKDNNSANMKVKVERERIEALTSVEK
jgi:hypothetical protein